MDLFALVALAQWLGPPLVGAWSVALVAIKPRRPRERFSKIRGNLYECGFARLGM